MRVEDHEWCGDMGPVGASCFNLLSDSERTLDKDSWDQLRFGQVCTSAESFANIKAVILKLCAGNKRCKFEEVKKALDKFEPHMRTVMP